MGFRKQSLWRTLAAMSRGMRPSTYRWWLAAPVVALLLGGPLCAPAAHGQVFLASHPNPEFTISALTLRATVSESVLRVPVDVVWKVATRGLSETMENTEVVSSLLDTSARLSPQRLEVEFASYGSPDDRRVAYEGRRSVPRVRVRLGWLAMFTRWETEHRRVEIELREGRVVHVDVHVRRE
jgi:hypothetical protein